MQIQVFSGSEVFSEFVSFYLGRGLILLVTISSHLLASVEALPSLAAPARYESHALNL